MVSLTSGIWMLSSSSPAPKLQPDFCTVEKTNVRIFSLLRPLNVNGGGCCNRWPSPPIRQSDVDADADADADVEVVWPPSRATSVNLLLDNGVTDALPAAVESDVAVDVNVAACEKDVFDKSEEEVPEAVEEEEQEELLESSLSFIGKRPPVIVCCQIHHE